MFWLLALPIKGAGPAAQGRARTWELLQEKTSYGTQLSSNFKLDVPDLRVGTLDTLLALSDDLVKASGAAEAAVAKIRRALVDVAGARAAAGLRVENLPVEAYLTRFKWDEPKFPLRRPLRETVERVAEVMSHIEDDLKIKLGEYNTSKSQLSAALRKAGGSLAVRDVSAVVRPDQVVDSENLTTLFAVVSKFGVKDWEATYEGLCDFVVPRSSRRVAEDADYALMSVVLFRRVADDFKAAARLKGYPIKEYVPPPPEAAGDVAVPANMSVEQLRAAAEAKRAALEAWARTAYGEAFSCWAHLAVVRLFVESILRYGLPPAFQAAVVKPLPRMEARLRAVLAGAFGTDSEFWQADAGGGGLASSEVDAYPYVSLTINTDAA